MLIVVPFRLCYTCFLCSDGNSQFHNLPLQEENISSFKKNEDNGCQDETSKKCVVLTIPAGERFYKIFQFRRLICKFITIHWMKYAFCFVQNQAIIEPHETDNDRVSK